MAPDEIEGQHSLASPRAPADDGRLTGLEILPQDVEQPCRQARSRIFNAQESLKDLVYNSLAIWKAVAIGACLQAH